MISDDGDVARVVLACHLHLLIATSIASDDTTFATPPRAAEVCVLASPVLGAREVTAVAATIERARDAGGRTVTHESGNRAQSSGEHNRTAGRIRAAAERGVFRGVGLVEACYVKSIAIHSANAIDSAEGVRGAVEEAIARRRQCAVQRTRACWCWTCGLCQGVGEQKGQKFHWVPSDLK